MSEGRRRRDASGGGNAAVAAAKKFELGSGRSRSYTGGSNGSGNPPNDSLFMEFDELFRNRKNAATEPAHPSPVLTSAGAGRGGRSRGNSNIGTFGDVVVAAASADTGPRDGPFSDSLRARVRPMRGGFGGGVGGEDSFAGVSGTSASDGESSSYDKAWPEALMHILYDTYGVGNYAGQVKDGAPHGQGKIEWKDGRRYFGWWKDGRRHGYGTMCFGGNQLYAGGWVEGNRHGMGVQTFADNTKYDGEWVNDKREGRGVQTFADNTKYDGEWVNDKREGRGVCTFVDNSKYDGEWVNDTRQGKGSQTYADSTKYDGEWFRGMWQGEGEFSSPAGVIYRGGHHCGKRNGWGVLIEYGCEYDGEFHNGEKNGTGTSTWTNGNKYVGDWRDGKQHGKGVCYSTTGHILEKGRWKNGTKTTQFF